MNHTNFKTIVVAKSKSADKYAYFGRELGMGKAICTTKDIEGAHDFGSAWNVMRQLGGHYRGFDAVEITVVTKYTDSHILQYPPEGEVWEDED